MVLQELTRAVGNTQLDLENTDAHDAAVVLLTPEMSRLLYDNAFLAGLAKILKNSTQDVDEFHLLAAIVDKLPPVALKTYAHGVSVLRSRKDVLLPHLWDPVSPKQSQDAETVAALTFDLPDHGGPKESLTLPLAKTIFHNNKLSTMVAARFDMSGLNPHLLQFTESSNHRVNLPIQKIAPWAPLSPLTAARKITESFGNIVRGVEVDGETVPASTELEAAINRLWQPYPNAKPSPTVVYALVTPEPIASTLHPSKPQPGLTMQTGTSTAESIVKEIDQSSEYVAEVWTSGGNLHKVLSGGGGWGKKKGLLSLDPQTSHFSLSEEKEMEQFFKDGVDSGFAPVGSEIQFFAMHPTPPQTPDQPDVVLGVSGGADNVLEVAKDQPVLTSQFVGLSDHAIYVETEGGVSPQLKLSVPGSRLFAALGTSTETGSTRSSNSSKQNRTYESSPSDIVKRAFSLPMLVFSVAFAFSFTYFDMRYFVKPEEAAKPEYVKP